MIFHPLLFKIQQCVASYVGLILLFPLWLLTLEALCYSNHSHLSDSCEVKEKNRPALPFFVVLVSQTPCWRSSLFSAKVVDIKKSSMCVISQDKEHEI